MSTIADIRDALAKAKVPLSTGELMEALGFHGATSAEKKPVYQAISNGVLKGHFTRHHSSEGLSYSINAEHEPGKRGPKPKPKTESKALARQKAKAPAPAAAPTEAPVSRPAELIDVAAPPPPAYDPADVALKAVPKPSDFDLRRRLDVIGSDIADAIADACDAQHPHGLIKALVISREALHRAHAALPMP